MVTESNFRPEKKSNRYFRVSCWTRYLTLLYASESWVRAAHLLARHWARSACTWPDLLGASRVPVLSNLLSPACIYSWLIKPHRPVEGRGGPGRNTWRKVHSFVRQEWGFFSEPVKDAGLAVREGPRQQSALLASWTFPMEHVDRVFWIWLNKSCTLLHTIFTWLQQMVCGTQQQPQYALGRSKMLICCNLWRAFELGLLNFVLCMLFNCWATA